MKRRVAALICFFALPMVAQTARFADGSKVPVNLATGTASNTDTAGKLVLSSGATTSASYTFTGTYAQYPVCTVDPDNVTPAVKQALSGYAKQVSTTSLSITVGTAPTSAITFSYICHGMN